MNPKGHSNKDLLIIDTWHLYHDFSKAMHTQKETLLFSSLLDLMQDSGYRMATKMYLFLLKWLGNPMCSCDLKMQVSQIIRQYFHSKITRPP